MCQGSGHTGGGNKVWDVLDIQFADLLTIGLLVLLEGLLSADNALVLAILVMGLPPAEQARALRYGMLGAFGFRFLAILLASYLMQVEWVKLAGDFADVWPRTPSPVDTSQADPVTSQS